MQLGLAGKLGLLVGFLGCATGHNVLVVSLGIRRCQCILVRHFACGLNVGLGCTCGLGLLLGLNLGTVRHVLSSRVGSLAGFLGVSLGTFVALPGRNLFAGIHQPGGLHFLSVTVLHVAVSVPIVCCMGFRFAPGFFTILTCFFQTLCHSSVHTFCHAAAFGNV